MNIVLLLCLAVLQVIHLVYYTYNLRKTKGYFFDFWSFTLIIHNVYFYAIFYPFAKSMANEKATGESIYGIINTVDEAFLITLVGYSFIWIGKFVYNVGGGDKVKIHLFSALAKSVSGMFKKTREVKLWIVVFIPLIIYVFVEAFRSSNVFDVRDKLGSSSSDRPLYNIASIIYKVMIELSGIYLLQYRKLKYFVLLVILLLGSLFFGSRTIAFISVAQIIFVFQTIRKKRIKLGHLALIGSFVLGLVLLLGGLRSADRSELQSKNALMESLIYGNNFSDLRDFAWVLSKWNHELFYGKTYFSGIISFIPSGLSEFRMTNSIGRVTTSIAGLFGGFHGGLRITIFGEPFLNFGYVGVVLIGFLFGYLLQYLNRRIMFFIEKGDYIVAYSVMLLFTIVFGLINTSGFFTIYIIFIPIVFIRIFYRLNGLSNS